MALHHFIHIGDTHLHPGPRQADRVASLGQILAHARRRAEEETLGAIVWPGDLFHAQSTIEDRNVLVECAQRFGALGPVLICDGNHDRHDDLRFLAHLHALHPIRVVSQPGVVTFRTPLETVVAAFVLPYPHRAGLIAAGVAHASVTQNAADLLDPIFMEAAATLDAHISAGAIPLMATHINIGGAVSSVGQPQIGSEIELNPGLLARLPASVAVMANHIHKHQQVDRLVYAGSIARMDYGEQEPKGVVEWTWDDIARAWSWVFVPLETPRQVHVEGRLTRDAFVIESVDGEHVSSGPDDPGVIWLGPDDLRGAYVRCRYRFKKAEVGALDVAKVHAEFAGCASLLLDPVAELEHSVRAPEIAAAVTLDEKVVAYAERQGIAISDGLRSKLTALQQSPADVLLAGVQASLRRVGQPAGTPALDALASAGEAVQA